MRNYFKNIGKSAIKQIIGMRNYFKSIGKEPGRQLRARHGRPGRATDPTRPPTSANAFQLRTPPPLHPTPSQSSARGGATGTARPPAPGLQPTTPPVQSVAIGVICPGPGHLRPAGPGPRPRRGGQLRRRDVPLVPAAATYWYPYTCSGDVLRVIIIARIKDLSRELITDRRGGPRAGK